MLIVFFVMVFLYEHFSLRFLFSYLELPALHSVIYWSLLFLTADFLFYWYHRSSHEVNAFWANHILHHQSEEFNISVGLRASGMQSMVRCLFWSFLPVFGFYPSDCMIVIIIIGVFGIIQHTETVGKLGVLDLIFAKSHEFSA